MSVHWRNADIGWLLHTAIATVLITSVLITGLLTASGAATAQQRTREAAKDRAKEALKAAPVRAAPGRTQQGTGVTFQDVLANPNDPETNLAYARQLISENRLGLAAATLERVLLLNPERDKVRLLYAVVMYRLDNMDEARAELQLLLGRPLNGAMKAEAERYLALIEARSNPLQRSASLTVGLHHDSNRNSYPGGGDFLVLNAPVQGTGSRKRDIGRLALGNVDYRWDTGGDPRIGTQIRLHHGDIHPEDRLFLYRAVGA